MRVHFSITTSEGQQGTRVQGILSDEADTELAALQSAIAKAIAEKPEAIVHSIHRLGRVDVQ